MNFETGEWLRDYDNKTFKQKYPDTPYLQEVLQDSRIRESGIGLYIDLKQHGVVPVLIFILSEAIRDFGWSGVNAVFCVYSVIISSYIYISIYILTGPIIVPTLADRIFVSSNIASSILEFTVMRRGFPELNLIRLIAIVAHVPPKLAEEYWEMGCYALSLGHGSFSQELIDDAHLRGMYVYMFTINSLPLARELIKKGVSR